MDHLVLKQQEHTSNTPLEFQHVESHGGIITAPKVTIRKLTGTSITIRSSAVKQALPKGVVIGKNGSISVKGNVGSISISNGKVMINGVRYDMNGSTSNPCQVQIYEATMGCIKVEGTLTLTGHVKTITLETSSLVIRNEAKLIVDELIKSDQTDIHEGSIMALNATLGETDMKPGTSIAVDETLTTNGLNARKSIVQAKNLDANVVHVTDTSFHIANHCSTNKCTMTNSTLDTKTCGMNNTELSVSRITATEKMTCNSLKLTSSSIISPEVEATETKLLAKSTINASTSFECTSLDMNGSQVDSPYIHFLSATIVADSKIKSTKIEMSSIKVIHSTVDSTNISGLSLQALFGSEITCTGKLNVMDIVKDFGIINNNGSVNSRSSSSARFC